MSTSEKPIFQLYNILITGIPRAHTCAVMAFTRPQRAHIVNQHLGLFMCAGERTGNSDQPDRFKAGHKYRSTGL